MYLLLKNGDNIHSLLNCIEEVTRWLATNFLTLNDSKTEIVVFGQPACIIQINKHLCPLSVNSHDSPHYITDLILHRKCSRSLRSSQVDGDRAFSVAAPCLWNDLLEHIRLSSNADSFKSPLFFFPGFWFNVIL